MNTIKHKISKFILSFFCIFSLASCESLDFRQKQDTQHVKIAILLPITGPNALKANEYEKAIKMGLSSAKAHMNITTYNSSNHDSLEKSLNEITQNGTDVIIGPIYTEPTQIVAEHIKKTNIIAISLSNNPILASKQLYVFGHAPMRQLKQITQHYANLNSSNFITLLPAGAYAQRTNKIIDGILHKENRQLVKSEFYDNSEVSIDEAVKKISNKVDEINENAENMTKPTIIIADDSTNLAHLLLQIKKMHLDKKANIISDNRIGVTLDREMKLTYTGSTNLFESDFITQCRAKDIKDLSFMHLLAYDAGKIVADAIGEKFNAGNLMTKLNSSQSFKAIAGNVSFVDNIAQRNYQIITKSKGKFKVVEPR